MKKKIFLLVVLFALVLFPFNWHARSNELSAKINKIFFEPEELNTKVFIESDASLQIPRTYYDKNTPSTIIIELGNVTAVEEAQIALKEDLLVETIKLERTAEGALLLIGLKEKVPYRIYPKGRATVVELNRIQRTMNGYILAPETEENLKKTARADITFRDISISEEENKIHIAAKLTDGPATQLFALENPLRLVVDFFNTYYPEPTYLYTVRKLGIEKVRTGQFQLSAPYTIARMVFHLSEPRYYTIASAKEEFIFSFYRDDIAQTPPVISTAVPTAPPVTPAPPPVIAKEPAKEPEPVKEEAPPKVEEKITEAAAPSPKPSVAAPVQEQLQVEQFKPKTLVGAGEKYTGEPITLRFKDADLRDIVLYLGYQFGFNVVFDPEVRGTVTCDFQYIPWDQALDIILRTHKMGKTIEGNVLRIAPISVLTREDEQQRAYLESKELAGETVVKTFNLSYSKAKDMEKLIKPKLSKRGEMIIDDRTNILVISDVEERIALLEKLIGLFDAPNRQVTIEARIVEASTDFVRSLGIQWGLRGVVDPFYGNQTNVQFPNKILVDGALIPLKGQPLGGYAINLPAPGFSTALGLSFGNILDTFKLDLALSALERSGRGRIISQPTVTAQNNKQAEILQGEQIPVQTTANFTTTTRYVPAALELRATPQITAEGTIIMDIDIRNNAANFANLVLGIPPITTQSASTTVMVPDGGTTVIGGIFRTEDSITRGKVPFLHKIPILGSLFRNFSRTQKNRELIIFITPRIIK